MGKSETKREAMSVEESRNILGGRLSFAAAEAYRLLRTNLEFSFAADSGCKIIGVTSAVKEEGKSTTSINLAYTMAQNVDRVLLIEADLRLPNIARRLRLKQKPGLSNLLIGQCSGNDVLQRADLSKNLWVITAGDIPPNPAELLGSENMQTTLKTLSEIFDVIIVDLPPITVVADAALISRFVDGVVVVVRQHVSERRAVDEAVRQLRFVKAKILGFVMTGADTQKKGYKRYDGKVYGENRQHTSANSGR